ncbi:MAG: NlpC/P60 family protein [Candidatus Shapirobacteria bacterium]|jgi:cell wall-associated NlpC family hydrolase
MANRTDGSSALQDIDRDVFSGGAKVFNIDDYKKNKNPVEQKIVELGEKITKNLNGDGNLKNELESKIKSIFGEEEIKTSGEEIKDLIEVVSKNLIVEDKKETEIEVKKIKIEMNKWKKENVDGINEFKKEVFEKKLLEETKKMNPDLKAEESNNVRAYGKLVSEIYFSESIIDEQKDEALQNNNQFGPGKLENAWTDLRGVTNFLTKKPEEVKEIKNRYESIRGVLKNVNLPKDIKEVRSFENVISGFNDQGVSNLFSRTQGYLGWYRRVDKLTGGWLNKTMFGTKQKLISKIGNQAISEFAKNSLGVIAEQGFQKGISTVLSGILSGGVKAAATTGTAAAAGAATAAGAAAISATGIGAIVVAVAAAAKILKNVVSKIAEKLGIGIKKGLEENFGKVGGAIIGGGMFIVGLPFLLIGAVSAAVMGPIILLVFGGLFGYQILMGNSVSSLVPPEEAETSTSIFSETPYISSSGPIVLPTVDPNQTVTGQMVVDMASSLLNKVCYWYGGGHQSGEPVRGIDMNWGTTNFGNNNSPSGSDRNVYGLDCSGFVIWTYHQLGIETRGNVASIYAGAKDKSISSNSLQLGDIGIEGSNDHIGIFAGRDSSGNLLWIHDGAGGNLDICGGGSGFVKMGTYSRFTKFARIL